MSWLRKTLTGVMTIGMTLCDELSSHIVESTTESKPMVKYLRLTLDSRMGVFEQIKVTADKAATRISVFSV